MKLGLLAIGVSVAAAVAAPASALTILSNGVARFDTTDPVFVSGSEYRIDGPVQSFLLSFSTAPAQPSAGQLYQITSFRK